MDLEKAIEFIKQKHAGQKRKQGTPYYTHPLAVANLLKEKGFSIEYQIAGLFHDLLEDTDATLQEIIELSNEKVAEAVRLVTKTDGYVMSEYIKETKEWFIDLAKGTVFEEDLYTVLNNLIKIYEE